MCTSHVVNERNDFGRWRRVGVFVIKEEQGDK